MLDNIRIILVRPFHPGNIGSAARAMKTMGLKSLYLVNPRDFPNPEAWKMARSAADVVDNAQVVDSVYAAVEDCQVVMATTARSRGFDRPLLMPEEGAELLNNYAAKGNVALLFGPERMGLTNEDLLHAKYRVTIPTSPDYPSLNIAAAVQTLCYEIYRGALRASELEAEPMQREAIEEMPTTEDLERFYTHLMCTFSDTGFVFKEHPGDIEQKFRRMFAKAELTKAEVNIFRGMLASVDRNIQKA